MQNKSIEENKGGSLARLAALWCKDARFFEYICTQTNFEVDMQQPRHAECRRFILEVCRIESRRFLDHNKNAAKRFHNYIRLPFMAYIQASNAGHV